MNQIFFFVGIFELWYLTQSGIATFEFHKTAFFQTNEKQFSLPPRNSNGELGKYADFQAKWPYGAARQSHFGILDING